MLKIDTIFVQVYITFLFGFNAGFNTITLIYIIILVLQATTV